jgi:deazaflavin-dependent oxidoreductase (nitroreductase family)
MTGTEANQSYFTPSPRVLRWLTRTHVSVYRATSGLIGSKIWQFGEQGHGLLRRFDVMLLTTIGRKSGLSRTVALPYFTYEGRVFVVASNAASEKNPDWFTNLVANPEVWVQMGGSNRRKMARPLEGDERDRLWEKHVAAWPRWRLYQQRVERKIPLVEFV